MSYPYNSNRVSGYGDELSYSGADQSYGAHDQAGAYPYPTRDNTNTNTNLYPPTQHQAYYTDNAFGSSSDSLDHAPLSQNGAPVAGGATGGLAGYGAVSKEEKLGRSAFSEEYKDKGGFSMSKGKWGIVAAIALIVIGVGVGAGVALSKKSTSSKSTTTSSSDSNSTSSSSSLQYISGTAGVVKSNPSDPSQFEKDSALHQVFYGLGYTPYLSQEPECGATLANVTEDIQLMSQMTTRLRMYGSACNQSQLVLQAIQDTKVNMTVYLGAYVGTNTTVNAEQQQYVIDALNIYGADLVDGVIIGNEYVLDSTDTEEAITYLVSEMKSFRTTVNALGLSKTIPVGTGDAGSELTLALAEGGDFFMANVHAFFGGVPIDQAAGWTWEYFTDTDVAICNEATNSPLCAAGELGWPSNSMTAENMTDGAAVAGVSELQTFLDTYVCQANTNGTVYYYFEPFDESWKEVYGGVEPYWGLFDQNKVLKNITLPSC